MSRLLDGMPWTPACATDIRKTFARANEPDVRKPDLEGALRCMKKLQRSNVTALGTRRKRQ